MNQKNVESQNAEVFCNKKPYFSYVVDSIRSDSSNLFEVNQLINTIQNKNTKRTQNCFFGSRERALEQKEDFSFENNNDDEYSYNNEDEDAENEKNDDQNQHKIEKLDVYNSNLQLQTLQLNSDLLELLFYIDVYQHMEFVLFSSFTREINLFHSFCTIINPQFVLFNESDKDIFRNDVINHMLDCIDDFFSQQKYKLYGYDIVHMKLLLSQLPQRIDDSIVHFLSDYTNSNVIKISVSDLNLMKKGETTNMVFKYCNRKDNNRSSVIIMDFQNKKEIGTFIGTNQDMHKRVNVLSVERNLKVHPTNGFEPKFLCNTFDTSTLLIETIRKSQKEKEKETKEELKKSKETKETNEIIKILKNTKVADLQAIMRQQGISLLDTNNKKKTKEVLIDNLLHYYISK